MLRRRHLPFSTGTIEWDQWLLCMKKMLDDRTFGPGCRDQLVNAVLQTADHLRKRRGHALVSRDLTRYATMQRQTTYERLGGEAGVRKLVDQFYDYMDQLQEASTIRALHASNLKGSRHKLFLFLSGWLGGPSLYVEKYGHPMLRRRHLPFSIGAIERDQWLLCMKKALDDMALEPGFRDQLMNAFRQTADHMRNRPEHEPGETNPGLFPVIPHRGR